MWHTDKSKVKNLGTELLRISDLKNRHLQSQNNMKRNPGRKINNAIDNNGQELINLIERYGLKLLNADSRCQGKITRHRETINGIEESVLDYMLVCENLFCFFLVLATPSNGGKKPSYMYIQINPCYRVSLLCCWLIGSLNSAIAPFRNCYHIEYSKIYKNQPQ